MKGRREGPDDPVEGQDDAGKPAPDFRYTLLNTPTVDRRLDSNLLEKAIKRHVVAQVRDGGGNGVDRSDQVPGMEPDMLLDALLVSDQAFLDTVVPSLIDNAVSLHTFYRVIVRPVAARLGDLWCEDEINFVKVEIISMRLRLMCNQLVARRMAGRTPWLEDERRRVLLAHTGGDRHTLGFSMAEAFFQDAGWHVAGGSDLEPGAEYYEALRHGHFSLVALAFSRDDACDPTELAVRTRMASSNQHLKICYGGVAVSANPDRYRVAGADIVAVDAPDALRQAETMLLGSRGGSREARGPMEPLSSVSDHEPLDGHE